MRGKFFTEDEKVEISALRDTTKCSLRVIARKVNRSHSVVSNYLKDRDNYGKRCTSRYIAKVAEKRRIIVIIKSVIHSEENQ